MKFKNLKIFASLALSVIMMSSVTVSATSNVVFDNDKQVVVADLFDSFKGVMPGDELSQDITIKNDCSGYDYIKVYVKAEPNTVENIKSLDTPTDADVDMMNEFLSNLDMTVEADGKEIFKNSPDQQDTLTENVLLGTLNKKETVSLNVKLNVPMTMGNELANRNGEVDWVFTVEGYNNPKGDSLIDTGLLNWPIFVLGGLGLLLMILGLFIILKKKDEENT